MGRSLNLDQPKQVEVTISEAGFPRERDARIGDGMLVLSRMRAPRHASATSCGARTIQPG